MSKRSRAIFIKIGIIAVAIVVIPLAINWLMTYKLEDSLRKRLQSEVVKATNGFYDFSYDKLSVGLFTGELMIEGLAFWPDSAILQTYKEDSKLPTTYFDVHIDTIYFKGINLTWLFDYRKLSFQQFLVNHPSIRVTAPQKTYTTLNLPDSLSKDKSLYEIVSPFFDVIHTQNISLNRADVQYIVEDSIVSFYSLRDFQFTAHNFLLDEDSQHKEHLLFSDNFEFSTNSPQAIYDSEHFLFSIDRIRLSTIDSLALFGGANLQTKEKYWDKRLERPGSYSSMIVNDIRLGGIEISRQGRYNFLDARVLSINNPSIQYFDVEDEQEKTIKKQEQSDTLSIASWSLFSITSPLLEKIDIDLIRIDNAKFTYTNTKNSISDFYTLNKLDFLAHNFVVDSLHKDYNIFNYVDNFLVKASNVQGFLQSRNGIISVDSFKLSSLEKAFAISNMNLVPILITGNKDYMFGKIKDFQITGIEYGTGLEADLIRIESPKLEFVKAKGSSRPIDINDKNEANAVNKLLDAIAPFISHVSVKNIAINNGNASFTDQKSGNKYKLSNLDFYAKNFYIDKETRLLRDFFFRWDEYSFRFRDFDNLTPDKKYRIQIKEGDFDSVSGDMLLRDLSIAPEDEKGSYINIVTPYASLLGLDERAVRNRKISFKTFILDSPVVEVVKDEKQVEIKTETEVKAATLNLISFDLLTIPSPTIFFYDVVKGSSTQIQSIQMHVDSFRWDLNNSFRMDNLVVESPYVSIVQTKESLPSGKKSNINIASFGKVDIGRINIRKPILKIKKPNSYLDISADNYLLESLHWDHRTNSILQIEELDLENPNVFFLEQNVDKKQKKTSAPLTRDELLKKISAYANETKLGRFNISNLNARYAKEKSNGERTEDKISDTHFLVENLRTALDRGKLDIDELAFKTSGISYPIMDSFYTVKVGNIDFSKTKGTLNVSDVKLEANYPKFDFAYKHPRGADWFNIAIDSINLSGIDTRQLITDTILLVKKMKVNNVLLENYKNQKIDIEHNVMPLLYEQFQQLPLRYGIDDLAIRDFTVIYEELAKNGYHPARIPFSNMNGRVKGFTNLQKNDNTFYTLHADGLMMGTAPFVAEWKIPVDSTNDRFFLSAEIRELDMQDFNQLVRPMAPAYVQRGKIEKLSFQTEASSLGAEVDMEFVYDSLYLVILREMNGDTKHRMMTHLVNRWGIKQSNYGKNIRLPHSTIVRDPYHSNFNYFWQILQPPLVESVGVSQEKQNILHNLNVIFNRIKRFFGKGKKEDEKKKKE